MSTTAEITPDELNRIGTGGVSWAVIYRKGSTFKEAEAYLYGGNFLFQPWGDENVFLLAWPTGSNFGGTYQIDRYRSGSWAVQDVADPAGAEDYVIYQVADLLFR